MSYDTRNVGVAHGLFSFASAYIFLMESRRGNYPRIIARGSSAYIVQLECQEGRLILYRGSWSLRGSTKRRRVIEKKRREKQNLNFTPRHCFLPVLIQLGHC